MIGAKARKVAGTVAPGVLDTPEYHVIYTNGLLDYEGDMLAAAAAYLRAATEYRRRAVVGARNAGKTWAEIGAALGISRQGAFELYRVAVRVVEDAALTRRFRVGCTLCGWYSASNDSVWTWRAGEVHAGILRPGHVIVSAGYPGAAS